MNPSSSIGLFDSGMGGLTVLRALKAQLPGEKFIYLGDTARLPYGTKSGETVTAYALAAAKHLQQHHIKMLVVACNTASSVALPALIKALAPIPVIGVIEPGAQAAKKTTYNGHIAVLATERTVKEEAYPKALHQLNSDLRITQIACPLFVSLSEEGLHHGAIANAAVQHYLSALVNAANPPDTLLLGCTHFPLLAPAISAFIPIKMRIVDSAKSTAETVALELKDKRLENSQALENNDRYLVTDSVERFARVGSMFLQSPITHSAITLVDL